MEANNYFIHLPSIPLFAKKGRKVFLMRSVWAVPAVSTAPEVLADPLASALPSFFSSQLVFLQFVLATRLIAKRRPSDIAYTSLVTEN